MILYRHESFHCHPIQLIERSRMVYKLSHFHGKIPPLAIRDFFSIFICQTPIIAVNSFLYFHLAIDPRKSIAANSAWVFGRQLPPLFLGPFHCSHPPLAKQSDASLHWPAHSCIGPFARCLSLDPYPTAALLQALPLG